MPNRYVRDELIRIALGMAQVPNLEAHDMPDGHVVAQDAYMIDWLQEVIDFWHHMLPFSATVTKQSLDCTAHSDTVILPADFIVDVRNGFIVQTIPGDFASFKQIIRLPLQKFIRTQLQYQRPSMQIMYPYCYCVAGDDNDPMVQRQTMLVTPQPDINTIGALWYYKMPDRIEANQRPKVPNDYVCVEYLRIRALEWHGIYEPGTAQKFTDKILAGMKANGLLNEPEDDVIPFDPSVFLHKNVGFVNPNTWMGPV